MRREKIRANLEALRSNDLMTPPPGRKPEIAGGQAHARLDRESRRDDAELHDRTSTTNPLPPPRAVGKFASFDGTEIVYEIYGPDERVSQMPPLVCCNGIACVAHAYWDPVVEHFAARTGVVLWDYRGHGVSSPPRNPSEVTVPSFARDLLALLDETGIDSAFLVGHSFGVQVALEALRLQPDVAAGLVAVAGPHRRPLGDLYGLPIARAAVSVLEPLAEALPTPLRVTWNAAFRTPLPFVIGKVTRMAGPSATPEGMRNYFDGLGALDPVLLLRMFKVMDYQDATDLLPALDLPALLVAGGADVMTPLHVMKEMHELLPQSRLEILENAGHTLPLEAREELCSLISDFVDSLVEQKADVADESRSSSG